MKPAYAPAAIPALLFLLAVYAEGDLVPSPIGGLAVGTALAAAVRGRLGLRCAALFLGLLAARLQPEQGLAGLDPSRPVEAAGRLVGDWRREPGGASALLELDAVRQGWRLWTRAPAVMLDLGETTALPAAGSQLRLRGYLSRSPGFANAHAVAPGRPRLRVKSSRLLSVERPPAWPARWIGRLRATVGRPLAESSAHHRGVGYARALLLGQLDDIAPREQLGFRRSGLAHLLAVSGMNVALVAGVAAALGSFCRRSLRLGLIATVVLLHLALVGPVPSLLRATFMAAAGLFGLLLERRALALQSLAVAAAAMVALHPALVRDLGFCLSCSATFGLVVLAPYSLRGWPSGGHPLAVALAVSWSAQAATLPWALATFSYLSPAAPLLNLVAVPLAGLLLVAALGWIALALIAPGVAELAAWPLDLAAAPFALLPAIPPGPWLCLPLPPSWGLGCALATVAVAASLSPRAARRALLAVLLLGAQPRRPTAGTPEFEWTVADVGQGDGSLLRQGSAAMLVDGGGGSGPRRTRDFAAQIWLPLLAARGLSRLDVAVVTHADSDHCGGLVDVASYVPIGELWAAPELREVGCVAEILSISRAAFRGLVAGESVRLSGLRFAVLNPPRAGDGKDNDRSLVLAVEAGGRRLLLTGDIERRAEGEILHAFRDRLQGDLLKVAHHGAATSTGDAFLSAAAPRMALVSAGVGNRFGHPAPEVLRRLAGARSRILRTDLVGEIDLRWGPGTPLRLAMPGSPRAVSGAASE